jgi:MarR family 2-MHQ and catechol resistance regulon transcriptional repressor
MKTTKKYGKKADLALSMWVKLGKAFFTFGKLTQEHIKTIGLTEPQFSTLECIGHLGTLTLTELSKKQLVTPGNMTCIIDNLEKQGLLKRAAHETDRRVYYAELTPKGKKLFQETFKKHSDHIVSLASVLTEREQETLSKLLKKLGTTLTAKHPSVFEQVF